MKTIKIIQTIVLALCYLCFVIIFVSLIGENSSLVFRGTLLIIAGSLIIINEVLIMVKEFKFKKEKNNA